VMIAALEAAAVHMKSESHDGLFPIDDVLRYILDTDKDKPYV